MGGGRRPELKKAAAPWPDSGGELGTWPLVDETWRSLRKNKSGREGVLTQETTTAMEVRQRWSSAASIGKSSATKISGSRASFAMRSSPTDAVPRCKARQKVDLARGGFSRDGNGLLFCVVRETAAALCVGCEVEREGEERFGSWDGCRGAPLVAYIGLGRASQGSAVARWNSMAATMNRSIQREIMRD